MPLAPIADVSQVTVGGALAGGETWANVLNFRRISGQTFDLTHALDLTAAVRSAYANLQGFWPSTTVLQQFTVRDLAVPGSSPFVLSTVPLAGSGTLADALPNDLCSVVTLETGLAGRRGRGRIFLPAPTKAALVSTAAGGPQFTQAYLTAAANFAQDLATWTVPPDTALVVVSRVDNLSRFVQRGYVDSKADTLRRRDNRQAGILREPFDAVLPEGA